MFEWFTAVQIVVALVAGLMCVGFGLFKRPPGDLTMGAVALVTVLLVAQLVAAIVAITLGNSGSGDLLEFFTYLVSAVLVPTAALFWGLLERSRWSTVILGVACFTVAIMLYRMNQIWFTAA